MGGKGNTCVENRKYIGPLLEKNEVGRTLDTR